MSTTATQTQTSTSTIPLTATSSAPSPSGGEVQGTLNYFSPPKDGSRPYNYVHDPPEGVPRSNVEVVAHTVPISDMRGAEHTFDINKHSFLPVLSNQASQSSVADFSSDESVKRTYYPEVERVLLDNLPGTPNRVLIFDHTIRRAPQADPAGPNDAPRREPVMRVHIDQTPASATERVRHHLPAEADELLKARYRLVNVWRPLNGAVEASPLAVADSQTVKDANLVGIQHIYPDRTGETAGIHFDPEMHWYYWSGMDNEERLLLQCFDSETKTRVPHTAFKLEGQEDRKQRESIEVRALVFG